MERKKIPKETRLKVYKKCGGRCAYCGRHIEYKEMQVDHVVSVYWHNGANDIDNYFPACRMCNFYKSTFTIEGFRERVETVIERLEKVFIFRLARNYGIIEVKPGKVEFYFEKLMKENDVIPGQMRIEDYTQTERNNENE